MKCTPYHSLAWRWLKITTKQIGYCRCVTTTHKGTSNSRFVNKKKERAKQTCIYWICILENKHGWKQSSIKFSRQSLHNLLFWTQKWPEGGILSTEPYTKRKTCKSAPCAWIAVGLSMITNIAKQMSAFLIVKIINLTCKKTFHSTVLWSRLPCRYD